jgi:cold shock CspA family protein
MRGTVARLVLDDDRKPKGFGFIKGVDGVERFFHRSSLSANEFDKLREGDDVEFEHAEGQSGKGPRAERVERV